jgi:2-phospho-L-lactate guanylyltransferase
VVDVFVPFSPIDPKSGLSPVLDPGEREVFARVLLADVLDALAATPGVGEPTVLSTTRLEDDPGVPVRVDDRELTPAVNAAIADAFDTATSTTAPNRSDAEAAAGDSADAGGDGTDADGDAAVGDGMDAGDVAIVMADLGLATPDALTEFFDAAGDVVLAPGRAVGTNALRTRTPAFRVDYHGTSFLDHRAIARDVDATVSVVDSHRLATDVDGPRDLADVLAHGDGRAPEWLRDHGFELATVDGRVRAVRDPD